MIFMNNSLYDRKVKHRREQDLHCTISYIGDDPEADMPVPDRLRPKRNSLQLVKQLKLSQRIGLLLFLNRKGALSLGGKERLLYLQERADLSAISAGLEFCSRLLKEKKLQSDFKHQLIELNRRPQSRRFRRYEVSRIGVGYRDKGTLPEDSLRARRFAQEENFVFLRNLPCLIMELIVYDYPSTMVGEWLDWDELDCLMKIDNLDLPDRLLLSQL